LFESAADPHAEDGSRGAAGNGENDAFGEHLTNQAKTRGAHGGANGDFFLPRGGTREEEIRDVDARDHEDEADEREEDRGDGRQGIGGAGVGARDFFGEDADDLAVICFGELFGEARGDDLQAGLSLLDGDAGFEGGEDVEFACGARCEERVVVGGVVLHADGSVGVHFDDRVGAVKLLFGDADDGDVATVEADGAADDVGIASEALLPITVAEDDDVAGAWLIAFAGEDGATEEGLDAEHCEEVAGDFGDDGAVGATVGTDADQIEDEGGHVGEDGSLLVVEEVEIGGLVGLGRGGALHTDGDETVGVFDGERAEEEDVGEAEDGGVGADAESEGEDGDEGEAGALAEHA